MLKSYLQMINTLRGDLIEDIQEASTATHVIASEQGKSLLRTSKLMISLCSTSNVVSVDWLTQSAKKRKILSCEKFLLLNDTAAEEKYDFSMADTLKRGTELRASGSTLLKGTCVYVCKGVAGKRAPPTEEFKLIVEAAGGRWLATMLRDNTEGVLIITSDPPQKKQLTARDVKKAINAGAAHVTTTRLFQCIIRQEMSFSI